MPIKKSELYSWLWKSCDELRGGMDASQYKDYVLVLLFMKYVSDKAASQKGYLLDVPKGGSFADMVALKGDKEIGDKINKIIAKLAEANDRKGVIDVADFNDSDKLGKGKEMVDRLSNLVAIFDTPALDFRSNRTEGLHQGRQQESSPRPGYPPHRGHVQPPARSAALRPHGAPLGDQRFQERLQSQPSALHRQHRAGGPARHRRTPAWRHP
jgi:hypothetical protein